MDRHFPLLFGHVPGTIHTSIPKIIATLCCYGYHLSCFVSVDICLGICDFAKAKKAAQAQIILEQIPPFCREVNGIPWPLQHMLGFLGTLRESRNMDTLFNCVFGMGYH